MSIGDNIPGKPAAFVSDCHEITHDGPARKKIVVLTKGYNGDSADIVNLYLTDMDRMRLATELLSGLKVEGKWL